MRFDCVIVLLKEKKQTENNKHCKQSIWGVRLNSSTGRMKLIFLIYIQDCCGDEITDVKVFLLS